MKVSETNSHFLVRIKIHLIKINDLYTDEDF